MRVEIITVADKMSPYTVAVNKTVSTIDRRSWCFRNLIVAVVIVAIASIILVAAVRSPLPLTFLVMIVPLCGAFLFSDCCILNGWRSSLLTEWVRKELDLCAFRDTVNNVSKLPTETVVSMLATLPSPLDLRMEQRISSCTRDEVAATVTGVHAFYCGKVAIKTAEVAVWSMIGVVTIATWRWEPLLGIFVPLCLQLYKSWLEQKRIEALKTRTLAAGTKPDFNYKEYGELVVSFQWCPLSDLETERFVSAVQLPCSFSALS